MQYLKAGWFDRAEPLFRAALGRHGDRPDILHFLAVCLAQRGAVVEAEGLWRRALARDPKEPMLSYNLALAVRAQGKLDDAARYFLDHGVGACVFTLGGEGAYYRDRDGRAFRMPAFDVAVKCTCGCGDAFDGGFAERPAENAVMVRAQVAF